jgi:hypothetical protein
MSDLPPPPDWYAPLTAAFADALSAPLDIVRGQRRSALDRPPPALDAALAAGATRGLVLGHEQLWMRRYVAAQRELPRVTAALGPWAMNALTTAYFAAAPPTRVDLGRALDGFAAQLLARLDAAAPPTRGSAVDQRPLEALFGAADADPWAAILAQGSAPVGLVRQCALLDEAVRHAARTPPAAPWRPDPAALVDLPRWRLPWCRSLRLVRLDWAIAQPGTSPPPPLPQPAVWASFRAPTATALCPVDPRFATLLRDAARRPFGEALARWDARAPADQREALHASLPSWIGLALRSGWWTGPAEASASRAQAK